MDHVRLAVPSVSIPPGSFINECALDVLDTSMVDCRGFQERKVRGASGHQIAGLEDPHQLEEGNFETVLLIDVRRRSRLICGIEDWELEVDKQGLALQVEN